MTALVMYAMWEVGWIVVDLCLKRQGPLLLTWFNFNPNMDEITYPFPNVNGGAVDVWEWRSNFIPHFIMDVITYSLWD